MNRSLAIDDLGGALDRLEDSAKDLSDDEIETAIEWLKDATRTLRNRLSVKRGEQTSTAAK